MSGDKAGKAGATSGRVVNRTRSVAEIEAEIAASRENLVETVAQLQIAVRAAVNPRNILRRQIERAQLFFVDEYGGLRPERVVITVGVVVTIVVVRRVGRRRRRAARG